ncbi:hypothetical protein Q5O89_16800 [Peribacillus frigoritolerans]|nr:hypothetical protein [Peribacillus frigoritolerans]
MEAIKQELRARYEAYKVLVEQGKLTVNDVRRLEGLKEVDPRIDSWMEFGYNEVMAKKIVESVDKRTVTRYSVEPIDVDEMAKTIREYMPDVGTVHFEQMVHIDQIEGL